MVGVLMRESRIYRIDYNTTFENALNSAKRCFNVEQSDINNGCIECKTRASIWSWGEAIFIEVKRVSSIETEITIDSSASSQLFDWGKSKENIEIFFNNI